MDVVAYGDADIDILLNVDHLPEPDEKIMAGAYSFQKGGMVVNTLVALSRLGLKVGYHGMVGDDPFGQMVLDNLKNNYVDTVGVVIREGAQTFFCVILVDSSGEKAVISAPTECIRRLPEYVSETIISRARHLHTTAVFCPAGKRAVDLAKKNELTVSLDMDAHTSGPKEELLDLLPKIDLLLLNKNGARKLKLEGSIEELALSLARLSSGIVCITLGGEGSLTAYQDQIFTTPAFDVEIVDTTGAGDAFAAGFIYGFQAGWSLNESATLASVVAALNCTNTGGHAAAPTIQEIKRFLHTHNISLPV